MSAASQAIGRDQLADARERMVEGQLEARGINDRRVLDAMRAVPRERFVREDLAEFAYEDTPLPIEEGQTISQPYIVALMLELAELRPGDRVLDVGTGSGYAAAVASRIVDAVFTIERHASLAASADRRFRALRYDNIQVRQGDGTLGWAEHAPYDAILVAAGSPDVPAALKRQLAVDGRLIIPVGGDGEEGQHLLRIRRVAEDDYAREAAELVRFVPLIGAEGWTDARRRPAGRARKATLVERVAGAAEPLPDLDDAGFGVAFDHVADARVVLLGEATHGTSEFYRARAAITRRLIERHGFTIVAVEGDWPDAARVDAYVRHAERRPFDTPAFSRFPTWMWRNREVADFVEWLRGWNGGIADPVRRTGFHGLDLYSLNTSIRAVLDYLDRTDPEAARVARERYGCLSPWQRHPETYGRAALSAGFKRCEEAVLKTLHDLLDKQAAYMRRDGEDWFDAAQNARLVANAERYYRAMYHGANESWNLRDQHMFETLEALLEARPGAKAVVWAHNSHIGDARATEMGMRGELNIGQLCRERFEREARLVGFGTHAGTVAAASDWDAPMEIKQVRPSREDSVEGLCHRTGQTRFRLDMAGAADLELVEALATPRLERAIGVIYRPETERWSHYFDAALSLQFDHYVWFDETVAVAPLPAVESDELPDTYPFGV